MIKGSRTNSTIWIFRHAQRDRSDLNQEDPSLSREGVVQAGSIADYFQWVQSKYEGPFKFFASPKKRSQETLKPAAQQINVKLQVDPLLDQRLDHESGQEFVARVQKWIDKAEHTIIEGGHLVVCSHSDWLDELLPRVPSAHDLTKSHFHHWPTAHFIQFSIDHNEPDLWNFEEWRSLP